MNNKALFICFEGLDGCGKTTQAKLLAEQLNGIYTREPSDHPIGKLIRQYLSCQDIGISPETFQLMFAADRGEHLANEIIPNIKQGKNVVIDRYFFSSIALGGGQEIDLNWLNQINQYYPIPDIVFYLKTSLQNCQLRLKQKYSHDNQKEFFEKEKIQLRAEAIYQYIFQNYQHICSIHPDFNQYNQIHIIDGNDNPELINQNILSIIKKYQEINK